MNTPPENSDKARRKRAARSLQALRRGHDVERVVFFSDAVFAIAMTLLVLDLKLPELPSADPDAVRDALSARWPAFTGFAVSFWIVASLWHAHHDRFGRLTRYDSPLVTLNLLLLFFVAFLPVPTALMFATGTGDSGWGPALYAITMGCAYLALDAEWWWAFRHGMLNDEVTPSRFRRALLGVIPMVAVFFLSIPIALLMGAKAAYVVWLVGMPVQMIAMRLIERSAVEEELRRLDAEDAGRPPEPARGDADAQGPHDPPPVTAGSTRAG